MRLPKRCKKQKKMLTLTLYAVFTSLVIVPMSSFRMTFHIKRRVHSPHILHRTHGRIYVATNSPSSDINASIEELEALHMERQSSKHNNNPPARAEKFQAPPISSDTISNEDAETPSPNINNVKKQIQQPSTKITNTTKPSLKSILHKPVGKLTSSHLNSLCNSIRHNRKGTSFNNLKILERILLEINHMNDNSHPPQDNIIDRSKSYLKRIHVFSMLTALSKDIRELKHEDPRGTRKKYTNNRQKKSKSTPRDEKKIDIKDVQRLVKVVTLLSKLRHSNNLDPKCYTKDVPSFATMIAAEASRYETSAVDAALLFLDMVEKEEGGTEEWDPRLIGAVLDALARVGRAEDAQQLLERAMGVDIPSFDGVIQDSPPKKATTKRLNPAHASPCYDALLRAWSKKALLSAGVESQYQQNTKRKAAQSSPSSHIPTSAVSSLAQARNILLNHMPVQPQLSITNKTCTAVLQGYSALGLGSDAEMILYELEALHLSPLYSKSSFKSLSSMQMVSSSLDVVAYNTVLHAYSQSQDSAGAARAERLFMAMKEQTPLNLAVANSTIINANNKDDEEKSSASSSFSFIPPMPDFISYSSMLNCYSKHGMISKAETLLDEMCNDASPVRPNVACYTPLINGLEKSSDVDAPQRILSLIEKSDRSLPRASRLLYMTALRSMRWHGRGEEAEILLDKFCKSFPRRAEDVYPYMLVLRAWERTTPKTDRHVAAERAEIFFAGMQKRADESLLPSLDISAYNILLNCYARAGEADKAEKLLALLEDGMSSNNSTEVVKPNSKSYSLVIKALANSDEADAVDRAWQILYNLGYPRESSQSIPFNLSIDNFNAMLKLFAKKGMAKDAEALLNNMDDLKMDEIIKESPDIRSYEAVLESLGRCGEADAPARAEALVTRLEVMSELGGGNPQPSLLAYNTLLNCYGNAGMAGKAERLLERLDGADSYSFGSTIKAITNSGKSQLVATSRAESLANKLGTANEVVYAHRISLLAKWGLGNEAEKLIQQMKERNLHPSIIHYTAALNAYAKNTDDGSLGRAELLFKNMEEKFKLDLAAYHGLLLNYATRGNSSKARRLLQRITDAPKIQPTRATFTMVIDSYARSKSSNAGQKAEELLDEMRQLHAAGNNHVEVSIVYHCWYNLVIK